MMTRQARLSVKIIGFDTHMILEAVPVQPPERLIGRQAINWTSRHFAEALQTHSRRKASNRASAEQGREGCRL
jgi:hypothetical protein